ncbi:MAG: putative sugar nucleotidyl transferase, partial [bacterium]|nr:putative sugar nucleotidyl transferase [bacterium]
MKIVLHDNGKHLDFAPLSLTRPVGDLRMGILTNKERYEFFSSDIEVSFETEAYLSKKFPNAGGLLVNACVVPDKQLVQTILSLQDGAALFKGGIWIAGDQNAADKQEYDREVLVLEQRWELYQK